MPYTGYFTSADEPALGHRGSAYWSVFREQYTTPNLDVPIDGTGEWVASCRDEATADLIATLLQDRPEDLGEYRAEHADDEPTEGQRGAAQSRYAGIVVDDAWTADVKAGISPDRALRLMYRRQASVYKVGDPDPTPDQGNGPCGEPDPERGVFSCTWPKGHTQPHVAGTGTIIAARWE